MDLTGNTHRAEFCIDKLYSPDAASTAAGPARVARFRDAAACAHEPDAATAGAGVDRAGSGRQPYDAESWCRGARAARPLHAAAFHRARFRGRAGRTAARRAIAFCRRNGSRRTSNFAFPRSARITTRGIHLELRHALEPWNVLGEEAVGAAARRETWIHRWSDCR